MSHTPRRFSLDEYHRLLDGEVLRRGSRTELFEGLLLEGTIRTERQAQTMGWLRPRLDQALASSFVLRVDEPLSLAGTSEVSPPFSVVPLEAMRRTVRHPASASLVVEVVDVELERIRQRVPLYARAGVDELWLVNLLDRQLEVLWKPAAETYQDALTLTAPQTLTSRAVPQLTVPLAGLFGS